MQEILKKSFHEPLLRIILYQQHQTILRAMLHSTCPSVSATRLASLGHTVNWLCMNREELEVYMEKKNAKVAPDDVWWVITVAAKAFLRAVDECYRCIQGRDKLVIEQSEKL